FRREQLGSRALRLLSSQENLYPGESLRRLRERDHAEAKRHAQLHRPFEKVDLANREAGNLPGPHLFLVDGFENAFDVADGARGGAGAVGDVVEWFHRYITRIATAFQCCKKRCEPLLALPGTAAVAIVHLDVRDRALGQPALDERA